MEHLTFPAKSKSKTVVQYILIFLEELKEALTFLLTLHLALVIFWGLPYLLLRSAQHLHNFWFSLVILISFAYFFFSIWCLGKNSFYRAFEHKNVLGLLLPLMIIIAIVGVGASSFAALTYLLNQSGYIVFTPQPIGFEQLADYYFWQFCTLIPEVDVVETLRWKEPFQYGGQLMSWLLLVFKIIMIGVVIDLFYKWNKWRKELNASKQPVVASVD